MSDELRFDGKTVIVTGAGRNLGREYAQKIVWDCRLVRHRPLGLRAGPTLLLPGEGRSAMDLGRHWPGALSSVR